MPIYRLKMLDETGKIDRIPPSFALFEPKDRRVGTIVCLTVVEAPNCAYLDTECAFYPYVPTAGASIGCHAKCCCFRANGYTFHPPLRPTFPSLVPDCVRGINDSPLITNVFRSSGQVKGNTATSTVPFARKDCEEHLLS